MKYISKPISKAAIAIMTLAAVALTVLLVSCSRGGSSAKPDNVDYYTCTMHPSVKSQDPTAKCPICSMDLVPVKKKGGGASAGHDHGQKTEGAPQKSDDKSMGMSKEEHAKISGGKDKQEIKGMEGMEGMK